MKENKEDTTSYIVEQASLILTERSLEIVLM